MRTHAILLLIVAAASPHHRHSHVSALAIKQDPVTTAAPETESAPVDAPVVSSNATSNTTTPTSAPLTENQAHAQNAESAAQSAQQAATVANQVASHATVMHEHARQALEHAHGALASATANSSGLSDAQKDKLKKADAELKEATKKIETEELEQQEWVKQAIEESDADTQASAATAHLEDQIEELARRLENAGGVHDAETHAAYEEELARLRDQLAKQKEAEASSEGQAETIGKMRDELEKMERQLETMQDIKALKAKLEGMAEPESTEETELGAQMRELEELLKSLEDEQAAGGNVTAATQESLDAELKHLKHKVAEKIEREEAEMKAKEAAAAAAEKAAQDKEDESADAEREFPDRHKDVGSGLPYGNLAPFGREDVGRELTDASIRESDKMVDQLEKAEVAEEKRSVFRALTRLRGAAITSYDGVARSQTGNIDEYAHTHHWRSNHPLHHLADEESDVQKWAFPENAD